jgi:crossover junction endodeoxyribonuclease RuvC
MTHVLGIDASLTSTGLAKIHANGDGVIHHVTTKGRRDDTLTDRNKRINIICAEVALWAAADTTLAVIEGPSVASIGGSPWDRAGVWWRIVAWLLAHDIPVAVVAPSCRAKWATGSGSANKTAVAVAMQRRFPTIEISRDDEADALALACMGAQHLGWDAGIKAPTAIQTVALAAAKWPEVA